MMDNDDVQIGRVLSRKDVLTLFGGAGLAFLAGCGDDDAPSSSSGSTATSAATTAPTQAATSTATQPASVAATSSATRCVVRPALTEGPYFVDGQLDRSDIRSDPSGGAATRQGVPLTLMFNVTRLAASGCTPVAAAKVDVWHCDAAGAYSDVQDPGFSTRGQKWLRGYLNTDANGRAEFTTIFPGWYQGRAVHIHFKVRSGNSQFTSQFFFDDAIIDQIHAQAPYASKGQRDRRNNTDMIFQQSGGQLTLQAVQSGGYSATLDLALQA